MLEIEEIRSLIKPRKQFAHKGNFGHALLIAGSKVWQEPLFSLPAPASVRE